MWTNMLGRTEAKQRILEHIVRLLISRGANIVLQDDQGNTALDYIPREPIFTEFKEHIIQYADVHSLFPCFFTVVMPAAGFATKRCPSNPRLQWCASSSHPHHPSRNTCSRGRGDRDVLTVTCTLDLSISGSVTGSKTGIGSRRARRRLGSYALQNQLCTHMPWPLSLSYLLLYSCSWCCLYSPVKRE